MVEGVSWLIDSVGMGERAGLIPLESCFAAGSTAEARAQVNPHADPYDGGSRGSGCCSVRLFSSWAVQAPTV